MRHSTLLRINHSIDHDLQPVKEKMAHDWKELAKSLCQIRRWQCSGISTYPIILAAQVCAQITERWTKFS
jgi:hypothetical protein